ncbi:Crp/Fnr family transcriptional regulator [Olivibacter sp. XZL3]|uniref:Crp/Fnr family transcriptional regulator n=1 Tax=Olivibacter sp. XZL3 TaxID=1735116 RepID=UPI0010665E9E|nr:cyclic nucleotide-binding domain-containing protein [Olivibacter sp. XZL3]
METLINNLLLFDRLTEQQVKLIRDITKDVHLQEGEYFAEPGDICSQLAFVAKGILRYNHYNRKAENITSGLIGEGDFVAGAAPSHLPALHSDYLQAITECSLSVIDKRGMEELSSTVSNWDNMVRKISQKAIAEKRSRILRPVDDDPEAAASQYLEKFPNLAKHLSVDRMLLYIDGRFNEESLK